MLRFACVLAVMVAVSGSGLHAGVEHGLKEGTPDLKSAGSLAFGPDGILFVGDAAAAAVFAIGTGDAPGDASSVELNIDGLNAKVAKLLGVEAQQIAINDLAVNPSSGNVFLSLSKKSGAEQTPALVRLDGAGRLTELSLKNVRFSKASLPNPPIDKVVGEGQRSRNLRAESITDLAYVEGKVIVAGLSNAEAPSTVRELVFPFAKSDQGISLEIYHGAHGKAEDYAPPRVFVPFNINGEPSLLAGFTCTPLVKFPLSSLSAGKKVRGTTVAELGNRNRPLDMIVYNKDGKDFLLMANSARGVMKISTDTIKDPTGITEPVKGGGTAGLPYETIKELQGVVQLDRLNTDHAVVLVQAESGSQDLRTIALP